MEPHSDPVLQADQVQIQQEKTEIDQKELPQKVKEAIIEGKETSTLKISKAWKVTEADGKISYEVTFEKASGAFIKEYDEEGKEINTNYFF